MQDNSGDSPGVNPEHTEQNGSPDNSSNSPGLLKSEDWWAIWIGSTLLAVCLIAVLSTLPDAAADSSESGGTSISSPLKGWLAKPGSWESNPKHAFVPPDKASLVGGILGVFVVGLVCFGIGNAVMGRSFAAFAPGYAFVFLLATVAYVLTGQATIKAYNLEYALWALGLGLLISNTIGTPSFARPAVLTEFYIKTGLVILGAEVLIGRLVILGLPGVCVAWIVTPIVLIGTYAFGQKILKMQSKSFNMVISADMSVCGVSAAIATAAACKAKKEELSAAIGMSLTFTVVMMVVMPAIIENTGMSEILGGAWMGGTIDSTGAVAAAGEFLGDDALQVATTIKMIQNILIGVTAFCVALYWVLVVEPGSDSTRPNAMEIWYRFPKFVLGFVAASAVFSLVAEFLPRGEDIVPVVTADTKVFRGWFFCLAFVCIGLETNFRELGKQMQGGKPLVLYIVGQSFNLLLTLTMAWLMFEVLFREQVQQALQQ